MSSSKLPVDLPKAFNLAMSLPESVRTPIIKAVAKEMLDPWQGKSESVSRNVSSVSPASPMSSTGFSPTVSSAAGTAVSSAVIGSLNGETSAQPSLVGVKSKSPIEDPETALGDEESILDDDSLSAQEKGSRIQKLLFASASDGDLNLVRNILGGPAKDYIDIDAKDDSGSTSLIYSSCFGNEDIVVELLRYGASVDEPDQCKLKLN